jgi:hypothetical protein
MVPITRIFDVFADYHCFLVADAEADWSPLWELITPATIERMFVQGDGYVSIGTVRNTTVPVTISVLDTPPGPVSSAVDRTNEGHLDVTSGVVSVFGISENVPEDRHMAVPSGTYRVRALYRNLDRVSPLGIEGEDVYEVQIWMTPLT